MLWSYLTMDSFCDWISQLFRINTHKIKRISNIPDDFDENDFIELRFRGRARQESFDITDDDDDGPIWF